MSYKFILDTNILKVDPVNKLKGAGLLEACNSGRFAFYLTPVLVEERFNFVLKGAIPDTARIPVEFLLSMKWQRLFNDLDGPNGIYTMELEGRGQSEYLFQNPSNVRQNLELVLKGEKLFSDEEKKKLQRDKDQWLEQKLQNRTVYKNMMEQYDEVLCQNPLGPRTRPSFSHMLDSCVEKMAINKIKRSIHSRVPKENLIEYWRKHRQRCPYFNKCIEASLFLAWYATAEPKPPIDLNAYEDFQHLVYLNGIDGIVSEDKEFMKAACQELFPAKHCWSIDEFVEFLKNDRVFV
jgi:hypothetical protein